MKTHKTSKHEVHKCKSCTDIFSTLVKVLKHVAKDHSKSVTEHEAREKENLRPGPALETTALHRILLKSGHTGGQILAPRDFTHVCPPV